MKEVLIRKFFFLISFLLILIPLHADEGQLIKVRKGDTISYLSFKVYGQYDPLIGEYLRQENPKIKDINLIYVGQTIKFPSREAMKKWLQERSPRIEKPTPPLAPPQVPVEKEELPAETKVRANKAVVTFLSGQVQVKKKDSSSWTTAQPNMILYEKDQIKVLAKSRAEIILDNQSVVRLAENSLLTIAKIEEIPAVKKHSTSLDLSLGKLWTKATKFFNPGSRYDVRTPTAIAGVQGTTYQVIVAENRVIKVKVYQGEVNVYNPFPKAPPAKPGRAPYISPPKEVAGPHEVAGPKEVSREEWTQIVLRQFQEITITDKYITTPASFDINQERQDEWVRWNEERDLDFTPPARLP
ncbi:MAG: FecR domain-containing protein [bacterium]